MLEHYGALSPILPVVPLRLAAEHDWIVLEVDGQHGGGADEPCGDKLLAQTRR